ncbi:MAG: hypothetical protein ACKOAP_00785, partial [Vulcanococcus sp.]
MQSFPLLKARLVHAEPGSRVVEVSAWRGEQCLGSCLGEAADAEQAEQRARQRLQGLLEATPAAPALKQPQPPTETAPEQPQPVAPPPVAAPVPPPAAAPAPRASLVRHGGVTPSLPKVPPSSHTAAG